MFLIHMNQAFLVEHNLGKRELLLYIEAQEKLVQFVRTKKYSVYWRTAKGYVIGFHYVKRCCNIEQLDVYFVLFINI